MARIAQSKITVQGQLSVPSEVRKRWGFGPGSTLAWDEQGDDVVVRRVGTYSSADIHLALFAGKRVQPKTLTQLRGGIRTRVKRRHARR
ncbi:MAG: AbrB/MazE/SpoVT family DNA-binding domain-containing protein [Myxococcaceae bacterium]